MRSPFLVPLLFAALCISLASATEERSIHRTLGSDATIKISRTLPSNNSYCSAPTLCEFKPSDRVGWVQSSRWRNSYNILYSCLATLFVCSWSILRFNLPGIKESWTRRFYHRVKWMVITLVLPEYIAMIALSELWLAKETRDSIRQLGGEGWTTVHGYFANMGGFVLEVPDRENPFPLTGEGLKLLLEEHVVEIPCLTTEEILDRSKIDTFAKIVGGLQVLWFAFTCAARGYKGLYVTPLEFLTAMFIGVSSLTYCFQWLKPKDINQPIKITCSTPLDAKQLQLLVNIHNERYGKSYEDVASIKRLPFGSTHFLLETSVDSKRPKWVRYLFGVICLGSGVYSGLHLQVRRELLSPDMYLVWRACFWSSLVLPFLIILLCFIYDYLPSWLSRCWGLSVLGFYCLARIIPFGLGFASLFVSLPVAAYQGLDWSTYIPHIG